MDAPKRIWAVHHETLGAVMIGEWADSIRHLGGTEYILASEHARIVAEKDAEIARLREALLEIEGGASPDHWVPQFQHCVDVARAALKGDDNG